MAPPKSRHSVLLEYSKMTYCCRRLRTSFLLLTSGILHFPTEWKLLLERVHHLVLHERYSEALELNIQALRIHLGAGRLWSSYIHITHMYVMMGSILFHALSILK